VIVLPVANPTVENGRSTNPLEGIVLVMLEKVPVFIWVPPSTAYVLVPLKAALLKVKVAVAPDTFPEVDSLTVKVRLPERKVEVPSVPTRPVVPASKLVPATP
jgi:hypothetical protein